MKQWMTNWNIQPRINYFYKDIIRRLMLFPNHKRHIIDSRRMIKDGGFVIIISFFIWLVYSAIFPMNS